MQPKVIITCAVTGAGDTVGKHPAIPVTPEQIANSALEAASAGATVVHCHVREPSTGKGSRKVAYYREVMERIRDKNKEVIINLTAGMGGDVESWFAYALALVFLLVRPQGLFGEKIIDRV